MSNRRLESGFLTSADLGGGGPIIIFRKVIVMRRLVINNRISEKTSK